MISLGFELNQDACDVHLGRSPRSEPILGERRARCAAFLFLFHFPNKKVRQNLLTAEDTEVHWRKVKSFTAKDTKEQPRRAQRNLYMPLSASYPS
jgi:hypothetical protein